MVNDARAFSLAESLPGAARGLGTVVGLGLGTGVGGGIAAAGDLLLGPLEAAVRRQVFLAPPERIRVLPGALGPYAGAIGAALLGREAEGETLKTASMA
jgi:glucokinase